MTRFDRQGALSANSIVRELQEFFTSGDAYALIRAYRDEATRVRGTLGTRGHETQKPAVLDDRGILTPQYFEQYLIMLKSAVSQPRRTSQPMHPEQELQTDMMYLAQTLQNMIGSVKFRDEVELQSEKLLKDLFARGKEIGGLLARYQDFGNTSQDHYLA